MRALFLARSFREKVMLLAFLLTMVLLWGFSLIERSGDTSRQVQSTAALLQEQQVVLNDAEAIEARMRAGIENLDPDRILSGSLLMSELDSMAGQYGVDRSIDSPRSQEGEVFFFHTVNINIQNADLGALVAFAEGIHERSPYMGLEEVRLTADRNRPDRLDARFRISSVELAQ